MEKIFVIAGHGAGDPGACANGYEEAERVRALAQKIKDYGGDSVLLSDFNRNYYKDKGISNLTISKDYKIIELHMDSGAASAKGGHVIIKEGFKADEYDNALASMIASMFPGRAETIVKRSNLANVNRAATKGYNYRMLECCFISNADDINKFNSEIDTLAKNILSCFGIGASQTVQPNQPTKPVHNTETSSSQKNQIIATGQQHSINFTGHSIATDGIWGSATKANAIRCVQHAMNLDYNAGLSVDGIWGSKSNSALGNHWVKLCETQYMVTALEILLMLRGYDPNGVECPGYFGNGLKAAVQSYQKDAGLTVDGVAGKDTFKSLMGV